jgi:hypothetical protein
MKNMAIWKFLNNKRLRDYPRLILIASGGVILFNILLRNGWIGGLTGILMWGDFIDYYAAGILYKTNITQLYNPTLQESTQLKLIAPTVPPGVTFYSYPPNAALMHSLLQYISLPISILLLCFISLLCVVVAAKLMHRYMVPEWLDQGGLSYFQLSILIFSSFAYIEGFSAGQMHSITLLLMVGILLATMKEKWFLAGILAAGLTYKPQFVIGFLFIWLVWKKYYAILSFILFSLIWNGIVLITKGINPYLDYLNFTKNMIYLPTITEGFPNAILSTTYSLIASMIPINYATIWTGLYFGIVIIFIILFGLLAYKVRKQPMSNQNVVLAMAMLFPLLITPYALLHDILLLFPVMILLAVDHQGDKHLLFLTICVYLAMLVIPLLSFTSKIALTGIIPTVVFIYCSQQSLKLLRD